jgi:endonuclease YncB( thermonuclease family)
MTKFVFDLSPDDPGAAAQGPLVEQSKNMLEMQSMVAAMIYMLPTALAAVLAQGAKAAEIPGPVPASVERVLDGDTVKVAAQIWVDQVVTISVRVRGVDAPELFRPRCAAERAAAAKAKGFVEALLAGGAIALFEIDRDKYGGRVVARIESEGGDVGAALLAEGLAVEEGASDPWCG